MQAPQGSNQAPSQVPDLASSQVHSNISIASMNLGGGDPNFCNSQVGKRDYMVRLVREVSALVQGADVVGLTEINPTWYEWLANVQGLCFGKGKRYKSCHDGHDLCIIWDADKFEPTDPDYPQKVECNFLPNEYPTKQNAAKYSWRQFMAVELRDLAAPQVTFTAGITHTISGSKGEGPRITKLKGNGASRDKSNIGMRGMEKLLRNHHAPSLAAGQTDHCSFLMGDFNVHADSFERDAKDAIVTAATDQVKVTTICAKHTAQRDLVAVFNRQQQWSAVRNDDISPDVMEDLEEAIGTAQEHWPLFFNLKKHTLRPVGPASSRAASSQAAPAGAAPAGSAPPPAELVVERVKLETGMGEAPAKGKCAMPAPPSMVLYSLKIDGPASPRTDLRLLKATAGTILPPMHSQQKLGTWAVSRISTPPFARSSRKVGGSKKAFSSRE